MPLIDLSLEELKVYKPELTKENDFDSFWEETKKQSNRLPLNAEIVEYDYTIKEVSVYNAYYDGFSGNRLNGWYILPKNASKDCKVPVVIYYHGYGGNKGYIQDYMKWIIQGYAVLAMDIRGQDKFSSDTAAYSGGAMRGWMTLGVLDKYEYYYRNVYMDSVRAIDFVCQREEIDTKRIGIYGDSQGGGVTIAVAALDNRLKFAMPIYPYLCHFKRSLEMYQQGPYSEIFDYFRSYDPEMKTQDKVFETLSYFDGMNLGTRIKCPVLMAIGLRDVICPPSTSFAAYNYMTCEKELKIYPHHGHEKLPFHEEALIEFARKHMK
jgi:cephalosporin-C deacetylase